MSSQLPEDERRLFARFKVKEGCLVIADDMLGLLEDISLGGLSFQYFHKGQAALGGSAVEIVLPFGHMAIPVNHYKVVAITPQGRSLLAEDQAQVRRYHLRFIDFTGAELRKFWSMIKKNCSKSCGTSAFPSVPSSRAENNHSLTAH